ncbi:M23 family metallopeptidase, partial [Pseudomonas viridiflava]|uniref:M23 family metallopeptidase n=1 Tax=Pseudomonas viridiflava TaxID=33069 RepID=UPI00197E69B5
MEPYPHSPCYRTGPSAQRRRLGRSCCTSIPAAGAGKVVYEGTMNGYGNLVVLEHANGTEIVHTLYAHMSAPSPLALGGIRC